MSDKKLIIFDWDGVIEDSSRYDPCWEMIKRICGIDSHFDLRNRYLSHKEMEYISNKYDFIAALDDITADICMASVPEGPDEYALTDDIPDHGRARYLYDIYQSVCSMIPYRRDVSALLSDLPDLGIDTALLSDAAVWDLYRQDRQVDTSRCLFDWRSCRIGESKRGGGLFKKADADLKKSGIDAENVLFIDDNEKNIEAAEKNCHWNVYLDKGFQDGSEIMRVISEFVRR